MDLLPNGWPRGKSLPKGWSAPLLSNVAHRESGHTPERGVPEYWNGGIKWLSLVDCDRLNRIYVGETTYAISNKGIENSSAKLLPKGVVVLSRDAGVGQSAITTAPMAVSQHFLAWQCSESLEPLFLYYWFQFIRPELERIAVGSTIKTIGLPYFNRMRIPLPPLVLQKKSANAFFCLDQAAYRIDEIIEAKREYKSGLAQQLLTGIKRFPEFVSTKKAQEGVFGPLPLDWTVVHIGDIAKESTKRGEANGAIVYSCTKHDGLVPSLEYFGKQVFSRNLDAYKRLDVGDIAYATNHIEEGSIGLLREGQKPGLVSPMYTVFHCGSAVNPEFLFAVLKTENYRRIFESRMSASVDRRGSLRWKEFSKIRVPLPSLKEQERIVKALNLLDSEISMLEKQRELFQQYKRGLLDRLLSGEIPVAA